MKLRIHGWSKDGYRITLTLYGVPFLKWLGALFGARWYRENRREWRQLCSELNRSAFPIGKIFTRMENGEFTL